MSQIEKNTQDQNDFENLDWNVFLNLDGHLQFAQSMTDRYFEQPGDRAHYEKKMSDIRQRQNDPKLTVSVIGEFSSGKSTFINSLLGRPVLKTSGIQGSVGIPICVENGPNCSICIRFRDGRVFRQMLEDPDAVREDLEKAVTDTEIGRQVGSIEVFLPADTLSDDIRLIDTPGINAADHRQEESTRQALEEQSDLSIVLISGIQVLSESFCTFLEQNLSNVLSKCCFVLTKMDLFSQAEQQRILEYTRQKLEQRFSIPEPAVFLYAVQMERDLIVLPDTAMGSCRQMSDRILAELRRQSARAKVQSTSQMTERLLRDMEQRMTVLLSDWETQRKEKMQGSMHDLDDYLIVLKSRYSSQLDTQMSDTILSTFSEVHQKAQDEEIRIHAYLRRFLDLRALRSYAEMQLVAEVMTVIDRMTDCTLKHMRNLNNALETAVRNFQEELLDTDEPLELERLEDTYTYKEPPIVLEDRQKVYEVRQCTRILSESQFQARTGLGTFYGDYRKVMLKEIERLCEAVHACLASAVQCLEHAYYEQISMLQTHMTIELDRCIETFRRPLERPYNAKMFACALLHEKNKQLSEDLNILRERRLSLQSIQRKL